MDHVSQMLDMLMMLQTQSLLNVMPNVLNVTENLLLIVLNVKDLEELPVILYSMLSKEIVSVKMDTMKMLNLKRKTVLNAHHTTKLATMILNKTFLLPTLVSQIEP